MRFLKVTTKLSEIKTGFFQQRLLSKYNLVESTKQEFWDYYFSGFNEYYRPELTFLPENLRDAKLPARYHDDYLDAQHIMITNDNNEVIGMYAGCVLSADRYEMFLTVIHPDYRRQGIYTALLKAIVVFSRELGVLEIKSGHSPDNNAILIAKLKQGFKVTSIDISTSYGPTVWLTYHLHPAVADAFTFRCDNLKMTPQLYQAGMPRSDILKQRINEDANVKP